MVGGKKNTQPPKKTILLRFLFLTGCCCCCCCCCCCSRRRRVDMATCDMRETQAGQPRGTDGISGSLPRKHPQGGRTGEVSPAVSCLRCDFVRSDSIFSPCPACALDYDTTICCTTGLSVLALAGVLPYGCLTLFLYPSWALRGRSSAGHARVLHATWRCWGLGDGDDTLALGIGTLLL